MKIIIVGGGVSGLATYLQLRNVLQGWNSHQILIYESHKPQEANGSLSRDERLSDSAAVVGNSIALSPNSVRLLKSINEEVYHRFKARGYVNEAFTFRTARGHTLAVVPTGDGKDPAEFAVSCPRWVLWECFQEVVGCDKIQHRKVVDVDLTGERPVVNFADGGEEDADLVLGADGVRSVVKKALFGEKNETDYAPRFEGFCGVGAFIDVDIPETVTKNKSMVFTFGPTGSFGYCSAAPLSQRKLGWWSNWGTDGLPASNIMDTEEIREQLRDRHKTWKDPVIQRCLQATTTDRVYPIWTTPDLPHWGKRGAVLLGDAAHTLQATSGQGAAQALEDSVTFSLLLAHYTSKTQHPGSDLIVREAIELASQGLYEIRHSRVAAVRERARNLYLSKKRIKSVFFEYMYYCFIYLWTNFPAIGQMVIGNVFKEVRERCAEEEVAEYLRKKGH